MRVDSNAKKIFSGLVFSFLVLTGTYNAIVINSESTISGTDYRLTKRLDEVYGNIEYSRGVAATKGWQKLTPVKKTIDIKQLPKTETYARVQSASTGDTSSPSASQAAVREELSLSLTGVINPKKWPQGIKGDQFSGNLATNDGVIESLSVSLPNDQGLSISFSEMTGNVFEYDFEGELYTGMMYQEGPRSYAVTLTNGPLEGTRLTFMAEPSFEDQMIEEENQRMLAEQQDSLAGTQSDVVAEAEISNRDLELQQQSQEQVANQAAYVDPFDPNSYASEPGQGQPSEQAQNFQQPDGQYQGNNVDPNQVAM